MMSQPAPFPIADLHVEAPDASEHIEALRTELDRDRPDPALIETHVANLRSHSGLLATLEGWYLDEKTQTFLAELSGAGL
jgi:hypothetical protein